MSRVKVNSECSICHLPAIEQSRMSLDKDTVLISLKCGHSTVSKISRSAYSSLCSATGKRLYPFQEAGVEFLENAQFRGIITDEMGLGKTVQYLATIKLHPELCPVLFVVKSGLKRQLELEVHDWTDSILIQAIDKSTQTIYPNKEKPNAIFPYTIISYEMLARMNDVADKFSWVKTIVIDECQHIKNEDAKRTNAVRLLVQKNKVENVIGVSGTPIKNRAQEFFPILNMVAPTRFPTLDYMMRTYFDYWTDSRSGEYHIIGARQSFYDVLDQISIRRTRDEVMPDLPKINRMFFNSEIDDKNLKKSYTDVQEEFEEFMNKEENPEMTSLLGFFARMRRITGFAKIKPCTEFVQDFLLSTNRKITIFGHHKETLTALKEVLDTWCKDGGWNPCLALKSELSSDERAEVVRKFKEDANCRILIASTLASGEGLNLQFCADAIMLERQWNPANEEQAEARFPRIGFDSKLASQVNITYMISVGTIDEWLTELVEKKRALMQNIIDRKDIVWEESSLMRDLADMVMTKGGKRWTY